MRFRMIFALFLATTVIGPAAAQVDRGGVPTETQDRIASQREANDILWNAVGLLGLLGLLGFRKEHSEDSYHPSSVD
jgi:hypothetical protein